MAKNNNILWIALGVLVVYLLINSESKKTGASCTNPTTPDGYYICDASNTIKTCVAGVWDVFGPCDTGTICLNPNSPSEQRMGLCGTPPQVWTCTDMGTSGVRLCLGIDCDVLSDWCSGNTWVNYYCSSSSSRDVAPQDCGAQTCTTTGCVSSTCNNAADINTNCIITLSELITHATKWVNNQGVTLTQLISVANIWVNGGTY